MRGRFAHSPEREVQPYVWTPQSSSILSLVIRSRRIILPTGQPSSSFVSPWKSVTLSPWKHTAPIVPCRSTVRPPRPSAGASRCSPGSLCVHKPRSSMGAVCVKPACPCSSSGLLNNCTRSGDCRSDFCVNAGSTSTPCPRPPNRGLCLECPVDRLGIQSRMNGGDHAVLHA